MSFACERTKGSVVASRLEDKTKQQKSPSSRYFLLLPFFPPFCPLVKSSETEGTAMQFLQWRGNFLAAHWDAENDSIKLLNLFLYSLKRVWNCRTNEPTRRVVDDMCSRNFWLSRFSCVYFFFIARCFEQWHAPCLIHHISSSKYSLARLPRILILIE